MADQTYNLTQTGAEVQAIINDANGVKGAGATTSLTTDYIMLKDTSGAYHKIQKSSFTEAVRNTLASLLVNNDKGTTISQIAAIASGDFGSVTPANLASVLGGAETIGLLTTQSISDYYNMNAGWKFCGAGYTGGDLPVSSSCFVEFKKQGTHSGLQILYYLGNVTQTYIRTHSGTSQEASVWSLWQRIDNYGTSSLSELASALKPYL